MSLLVHKHLAQTRESHACVWAPPLPNAARGAFCPAFVLLSVIRRKGIEAILRRSRTLDHLSIAGCARYDIMIEIDPDAHIRFSITQASKSILPVCLMGPVAVVSCDGLKPYVRPAASDDAVYAFKSPLTALCDILHHTELAEHFVTGVGNKAFLADVRTIYAVTDALRLIPKPRARKRQRGLLKGILRGELHFADCAVHVAEVELPASFRKAYPAIIDYTSPTTFVFTKDVCCV